jgi:hypothetical protein
MFQKKDDYVELVRQGLVKTFQKKDVCGQQIRFETDLDLICAHIRELEGPQEFDI